MLNMTAEALKEALSAPFDNADIEWRVGATSKDKTRGLAVPYVTNRAIQNRLDSTLGVDGWYNDYKPWPNDTQSKKSAQICGITIYFPEKDLWLTKWDGAENSDIEAVKGGLSDSMKRAAVQWGVGRYLYGMPQVWVGLNDRGFILEDDRPKLDQAHAAWVQRIRGRQQAAAQAGNAQQGPGPAPTPKGAPSSQSAPAPQYSAPATPPAPPPVQPPAQQQSGQATAQQGRGVQQQSQQGQQPAAAQPVYYQVTGSVLKPAMNGGQNTSLVLRTADGATVHAFRQGVAPELTPGVWLANVVLSQKNQHGVVFYTLDSYQLYTGRQAA